MTDPVHNKLHINDLEYKVEIRQENDHELLLPFTIEILEP